MQASAAGRRAVHLRHRQGGGHRRQRGVALLPLHKREDGLQPSKPSLASPICEAMSEQFESDFFCLFLEWRRRGREGRTGSWRWRGTGGGGGGRSSSWRRTRTASSAPPTRTSSARSPPTSSDLSTKSEARYKPQAQLKLPVLSADFFLEIGNLGSSRLSL